MYLKLYFFLVQKKPCYQQTSQQQHSHISKSCQRKKRASNSWSLQHTNSNRNIDTTSTFSHRYIPHTFPSLLNTPPQYPRQIYLTPEELQLVQDELLRQLWLRCSDHWYPEQPWRGQGYRCICLRLLHKRTPLFERVAIFDQQQQYLRLSNPNLPPCIDYLEYYSTKQANEQFYNSIENSSCSSDDSDNSCDKYKNNRIRHHTYPAVGYVEQYLGYLPASVKSQNHDNDSKSIYNRTCGSTSNFNLDTYVYIDDIIVKSIEKIRPDLIREKNQSRKYVEVLRYIDESIIDGNHEMMIWVDPGRVEVQHNYQENKNSQSTTDNTILYDRKYVANKKVLPQTKPKIQCE